VEGERKWRARGSGGREEVEGERSTALLVYELFLCRSSPSSSTTDGYGYKVLNGTVWGANIHMLHTVDIKGGAQGTKECIECWAGEGKRCDARANGSFACCHSDSHCPTVNEDPVPTQYRLRLEIAYTRNVSMVSFTQALVVHGTQAVHGT
jgi:hypothetical protein